MLLEILDWLYQNVSGNLVASAIWALPAFLHLHWRINKHMKNLRGEQ
jgi:hypothetical protein